MFEQATLTTGPSGKRLWTTVLGFTSQAALVSLAVLAPMVWPQVLPLARLETSLAPPLPPGPPQLDNRGQKHPGHTTVVRPVHSLLDFQPARVPDHVTIIDEEPLQTAVVVGSLPGNGGGSKDGVLGAIWDLTPAVRVAPPPHVEVAPAKPAAAEAPAAIPRLRQGGLVKLGNVLHRGEPVYPPIAKTAHAQGNVELECVVGVDGHIKEVKVKSGNPLLIHAAVDAAWQWIYEPTRLNGVPIEIITILTFNFKLN